MLKVSEMEKLMGIAGIRSVAQPLSARQYQQDDPFRGDRTREHVQGGIRQQTDTGHACAPGEYGSS